MRNRETFYTFAFYLKKPPNRYTWVAIKVGMVVVRGTCCWCLCHWRILLDKIWLNGVDWTWSPFFQCTGTARVEMIVVRVTCCWSLLHWKILLDNIWQNGVHTRFAVCKQKSSSFSSQSLLLSSPFRLVEHMWLQLRLVSYSLSEN